MELSMITFHMSSLSSSSLFTSKRVTYQARFHERFDKVLWPANDPFYIKKESHMLQGSINLL